MAPKKNYNGRSNSSYIAPAVALPERGPGMSELLTGKRRFCIKYGMMMSHNDCEHIFVFIFVHPNSRYGDVIVDFTLQGQYSFVSLF